MKPFRHHGWKFIINPLARLVRRRYVVVIIVLSLLVVSTAYAGAVFTSFSGPAWLGSGYGFIVNGTVSEPHKYVSISYSVSPGGVSGCADCTGGPSVWTCTIPGVYGSATINFDISAYPNTRCGGNKYPGWADSFTTSPTSIVLTSFMTKNTKTAGLSSGSLLLLASTGVVVILILFWRSKTRKTA